MLPLPLSSWFYSRNWLFLPPKPTWWGIPKTKGEISQSWLLNTETESCVYLKSFLQPWDYTSEILGEQWQVCGLKVKADWFLSISFWGNSVMKGKPLLVPRRLPRLCQGKKGVDDPIDGTCQRQSNPVARTTGAKGNGRVIVRHQGGRFLMTMRQAGWSYPALTLENGDHVSTCQKAQMPLRKVKETDVV